MRGLVQLERFVAIVETWVDPASVSMVSKCGEGRSKVFISGTDLHFTCDHTPEQVVEIVNDAFVLVVDA